MSGHFTHYALAPRIVACTQVSWEPCIFNPRFLPEASFWPSGIVVACVCLCVCVCPSVCPSTPSTKFGQKMQNNLVKVPIVLGAIDLNLQSQIWLQNQNSPHFELVRNITQYPFKLGSPNLDQSCKIAWLWSLWFWVAIDLDLQGQIWLKMSNFLVSSLLEIHNHHI